MSEVLRLAIAIQAVNNFSTAFNQAKQGVGGIKGSLIGLKAGLKAAGGAIAFFAVSAVTSFLKASVTIAAEFEKEMLRVQAVSGATGQEFKKLTGFARELGAKTEFTARQAAEAMSAFGMAGFSVNEILEATPVALDLATAGMVDMGTAAGITANILRSFGLETSETQRVGDVLTATFTNSFTTIESLGESFKLVAPTAQAAGLTFEQTAAAIGKLGDAGLQGSMAGTGLRQAIVKLIDPSEDAVKTMSRLGLELQVLTDVGQEARNTLDSQLPVLESLQSQQESLKTTSEGLGMRLSEIGIDVAKNNIGITAHEEAIESIKGAYSSWDNNINELKGQLMRLDDSIVDLKSSVKTNDDVISGHRSTIKTIEKGYSEWRGNIDALETDILGLQNTMAGFSLESKKNSLEIMKINQEADRQNRDLTTEEKTRIKEIKEANDELRIKREEAAIKQIEIQNELKKEEAIAAEENAKSKAKIQESIQGELDAIVELENSNSEAVLKQQDLGLQQIELKKQIAEEEKRKSETIKTAIAGEISAMNELNSENAELLKEQALLQVSSQESALVSQIVTKELGVQKEVIKELTNTVSQQVTGTVDFVDMLTQLGEAGATTSDIMQIFSTRGGSAMLALQNVGVESLSGFTTELENSQGALGDTTEIMRSGMSQEMAVMKSKMEDLQIEMGTKLFPVVIALFDAFSWVIDNVIKPLIVGVEFLVGGFIDLAGIIGGGLLAAWEGFRSALEAIWQFLQPVVDAIKWLIDNISKIGGGIKDVFGGIGEKIGGFFGFQGGTGLEGLPSTGPFVGHKKEIVLNPQESSLLRQISKQGSATADQGSSRSLSIGNININANSEEEGRAGARGVLQELESAFIRGEQEAF